MILQALVKYYESLLRDGKVVPEGWSLAKVSYALELSADGDLKVVIPLKHSEERGKKTVWLPTQIKVPKMVVRSSGVSANFLCDNSKYFLGVDSEGSGKRVRECFEAAREKHLEILENVHSEMAEAIRRFFQKWDPDKARDYPALREMWEEVTDGGNLIFCMRKHDAQEDAEICQAWEKYLSDGNDGQEGICLVTGKRDTVTKIHSTIKGVQGAQSSGAALVSFNAPAFESYGKSQGENAPVGEYAAFSYTTALNYLLSQRDYVFQLGDTTVVCWAENGEEAYQKGFCWSLEPQKDNLEIVQSIFQNLTSHKYVDLEGTELDFNQKFYILGLAPNAARLSVGFFYQNSFGKILENLKIHYSRMEIVKPVMEENVYPGVWGMLMATVNQNSRDKKPAAYLPSAVLSAILANQRYPESLYCNVLIRIRAEQGRVTWRRAAIIKAYLIRNYHYEKGDDLVKLNEENNDVAYVLGRMFEVLEEIQWVSNNPHKKSKQKEGDSDEQRAEKTELNTTIKDRYFNSASTTPGTVFPILLRLKNSHLRKMEGGTKIFYENILTELMGKIDKFPRRLTLEEQGDFELGYYHQKQRNK